MAKIQVIVDENESVRGGTLGVLDGGARTVIKEVDAGKIRASLNELTSELSAVVQNDNHEVGGLNLTELVVSAEITAEAGIALVGTAKGGAKGAITLKFSR